MSKDLTVTGLEIFNATSINAELKGAQYRVNYDQIWHKNPALESFLRDDTEPIFSPDSLDFKSFTNFLTNPELIEDHELKLENDKNTTRQRDRRKSFSMFWSGEKVRALSPHKRLIPTNSAPLLLSDNNSFQPISENLKSTTNISAKDTKDSNNINSFTEILTGLSAKARLDLDSITLAKAKQYIQKIWNTIPSMLFSKGHKSSSSGNKYINLQSTLKSPDLHSAISDPFSDSKASKTPSTGLNFDFSDDIPQLSGGDSDQECGSIVSNSSLRLDFDNLSIAPSKDKSNINKHIQDDTKRIRYPTPPRDKMNLFADKICSEECDQLNAHKKLVADKAELITGSFIHGQNQENALDLQALVNYNTNCTKNKNLISNFNFPDKDKCESIFNTSQDKSVNSYKNLFDNTILDPINDYEEFIKDFKGRNAHDFSDNGIEHHLESFFNNNAVASVFQNDTLRNKKVLEFNSDWKKINEQREIQNKEYEDNINSSSASIHCSFSKNSMGMLDNLTSNQQTKELMQTTLAGKSIPSETIDFYTNKNELSNDFSNLDSYPKTDSLKSGYKKLCELEVKETIAPSMEILKQATLRKSPINCSATTVTSNSNQNMNVYSADSSCKKFLCTPDIKPWMVLNEALRELRHDLEKKSSLAFLGFDPTKSTSEVANSKYHFEFIL